MSIHPEYADAILSGKKKVEFRKRDFGRETKEVVIYATSPVAALVGKFHLAGVEELKPSTLWRKFSKVGGIKKKDFDAYFEGRERGVAFKVGKVEKFGTPIPFSILKKRTPPQSFFYLSADEAKQLEE